MFRLLPGNQVFLLGRNTLEMLGISPNAVSDRIVRSKLERLVSAYRTYHSPRISLIRSEENLATARSLDLQRMASHDVGTPYHLHPKRQKQDGHKLANTSDRRSRKNLAEPAIRVREGGNLEEIRLPRSSLSDMDARLHGRSTPPLQR